MNLEIWHVCALVLPLVILEGTFSGSEIALLSADKVALKKQARQKLTGAELALKLASHPEKILSVTLVMTNFCMIGISSLLSLYFLSKASEHAELLAVAVTSPLVVLFGELLPKTYYQKHATLLARWMAFPVYWAYWAMFPVTRVLSLYTTRISRMVGPVEELLTGRKRTTREEIRSLLSYTRKETELKTSEKRMIKRIFDFKDTEAKHALIPLVRVDAIEDNSTVREALEKFEHHGHSRMPVFSGRIDSIIGILEAADLFHALDPGQPIRNYLTPAHYAAETQSLEDLLRNMRQEDNEMVVVVDEHGGAVGILTFEDIVEEVVGEISDEYDTEALPFKELSSDRWLVQARMEIEQINDRLKLDLPHGDYETLSGFLLQQFGRIPETRDELHFTTPAGPFKFTVKDATERHIESVIIEKLEK